MNNIENEVEFESLLLAGVNLNATDESGNTALLLAAENGDKFNGFFPVYNFKKSGTVITEISSCYRIRTYG